MTFFVKGEDGCLLAFFHDGPSVSGYLFRNQDDGLFQFESMIYPAGKWTLTRAEITLRGPFWDPDERLLAALRYTDRVNQAFKGELAKLMLAEAET